MRRSRVAVAVAVALGTVGLATTNAFAAHRVSSAPVYRVPVRQRLVALSFDDGPDPRWTPAVLASLARYQSHATFFDVGVNVVRWPTLVGDEVHAGHELADHTWSHPHLLKLARQSVLAELTRGRLALAQVTDGQPRFFRPPYGQTDAYVNQLAADDGMRTILWDLCLERYVNHQPISRGVDRLISRVRPGSIILAHDGGVPGRSRTLAALPMLLRRLAHKGYRVVTVGQLLQERAHKP